MKQTYQGSCHCGAVKFEADTDIAQGTFRCNCTICFKSRAWLAPVPAGDLRIVEGESSLQDYQFGKKRIHHYFCRQCGVRPFSRASDAKGDPMYAVRVTCLEGVDPQAFVDAPVKYFDMLHDKLEPPAETRHL